MEPLILSSKAAPLTHNPSNLTIDNECQETYYIKGSCVEAFNHISNASVAYPSIEKAFDNGACVLQEEEEKAQDKLINLNEFNLSRHTSLTSIRFTPFNLQSKLTLSPTGLAITANSTDEETAIGNIGFSKGIHYWEIICPISCTNINVGVVKEGINITTVNSTKHFEILSFRTTTPRIIGIKLDLVSNQLRFWLNGNFQASKTKSLQAGVTWYPCIKIKDKGNIVVFNPFAVDPENQTSIFDNVASNNERKKKVSMKISQKEFERSIASNMETWVVIGSYNLKSKDEKEVAAHLNVDLSILSYTLLHQDEDVCLLSFKNATDANEFKTKFAEKEFNGKKGYILEPSKLSEWLKELLVKGSQNVLMVDNNPENIFQNLAYSIISGKEFKDRVTVLIESPKIEGQALQLNQSIERRNKALDILREKLSELETLVKKPSSEEVLKSSEVSFINHLKHSDNMIVVQNDSIKLLRRELAGDFPLDTKVFKNKPRHLSDKVALSVELQNLSILLGTINWSQFLKESKLDITDVDTFFEIIIEALRDNVFSRSRLLIVQEFIYFKTILDSLLNYTVGILNKYRSIQGQSGNSVLVEEKPAGSSSVKPEDNYAEIDQELPFFVKEEKSKTSSQIISDPNMEEKKPLPEESPSVESFDQAYPLNSVYNNLSTLLRLEEQLFAMTHQDGADEELLSLFQPKISRLYSAFSRLSSFINFPENRKFNLIELAEAGLFNYSDYLYEVRHFLDANTPLESLINESSNVSIWDRLKQQLPTNRMINGLPSPNVELAETINNIPPSLHMNRKGKPSKIKKILYSDETSIIASCGEEGEINIWNAELALFKLKQVDFKEEFKNITTNSLFGPKENVPNQPQNNLVNLNDGELLSSYNIFEEDSGEPTEKLEKKEEAPVIPDLGLVENLYNMGFPVDLARKALIQVKNAGLSAALDVILTLQEDDNKNQKPVQKSNNTLLKPKWECTACTFVNDSKNNSKVCEICQTAAPFEAYFTEEELRREEEAQRALREKEQQKLEAIKKENLEQPKQPQISEEEKHAQRRKKFIENSQITAQFLINTRASKAAPLLVGGFLNSTTNDHRSMIKVRRLGFNPNYLSSYLNRIAGDRFSNALSQEFFSANNLQDLEQHLFHHSQRFAVETLHPVVCGDWSQKNYNFNNPASLKAAEWVELEEISLEIDCELVVDSCWTHDTETGEYNVYALAEKEKRGYVLHLKVIIDEVKKDPFKGGEPSLFIREIERWEVSKNYSRESKLITYQNRFLLITAAKSQSKEIFVTKYGVKYHKEGCKYLRLSQESKPQAGHSGYLPCLICKPDAPTAHFTEQFNILLNIDHEILWVKIENEHVLVVGNKSTLTAVNLQGVESLVSIKKKSASQVVNIQGDQNKVGNQQNLLKLEDLTRDDILNLRRVMLTEVCASVPKAKLGCTVISSHPVSISKKKSKHYFPVLKTKDSKNRYEIEFESPVSIINLKVDLTLSLSEGNKEFEKILTSNKLKDFIGPYKVLSSKVQPALPQESTKKIGEPVGKLGPPVFSLMENSETTSQVVSSTGYLPIRVHSHKGASYNSGFFPSILLNVAKNLVFVTNYPNAHFIFTHLQGKSMIIDSVTIESNFEGKNGGYPIGSGLLFTSNNLSSFLKSENFHNMTPAEYKIWFQNRSSAKPWEPVGCFEFDEKADVLHIELDYKREARYLFLKPTSFRSKPQNYTSHYKNSPLEIRFVGVKGTVIQEVASETSSDIENEEEVSETQYKSFLDDLINSIDVQAEKADGSVLNLEEWKTLGTKAGSIKILFDDDIPLTEKVSGVPQLAKAQLQITDNSLGFELLKGLKISLKDDKINFSDSLWDIDGLSTQVFVPAKATSKTATNNISNNSIRKLLLDVNEYSNFTLSVVKELTREKAGLERRKACGKLLNYLLGVRPDLVPKVFKDLDLLEYIRLNVLQERSSTFIEMFSFLKHFDSLEEFGNALLDVLFKILPLLQKMDLTHVGLKGYFCLLFWCHHNDSSRTFIEILRQLHDITKQIKSIKSSDYNILRTQYDIGTLAFEKNLFSTDNLNSFSCKQDRKAAASGISGKYKNPIPVAVGQGLNGKLPIPSRILVVKSQIGREMFVDLMAPIQLSDLAFHFEKNEDTCKFRIIVFAYSIDDGQKTLVINHMYDDGLWVQLSKYSYEAACENYYSESEALTTLGISHLNVTSRYLHIQITHGIQTHLKGINDKISQSTIIPEVFGEKLTDAVVGVPPKFITSTFATLSEPNNLRGTGDLKFSHSNKYDKFEVANNTEALFFDSTGLYKASHNKGSEAAGIVPVQQPLDIQKSQETLNQNLIQAAEGVSAKLDSLQSELIQKLYQNRSINFTSDQGVKQKRAVRTICENIEDMQLELFNINSKLNFEENSCFLREGIHLDFYYTLAMKLAQFLRKIDTSNIGANERKGASQGMYNKKNQSSWRQEENLKGVEGRDIALELFEVLVVYEASPTSTPAGISNEILNLLSEVLIDNLNEREWKQFIIIVMERFLSNPISLANSPKEQVFSHSRVIEALDMISIPNGEILAYLASKLGMQLEPRSHQLQITNLRPLFRDSDKKQTLTPSLLCSLASMLILLNKGFKKIPVEPIDPRKIVHRGSYCFNCGQIKFIAGTRLKCLNCPNLDSCSNPVCEQKHLLNYPNHTFIVIEEPLPLAPQKGNLPEPTALSPVFIFADPLTDNHDVKCDGCQENIVGVRMMCVNCEEYSLCNKCYEKKTHIKYHVFAKIDNKIMSQFPNSTPKCLVQVLDPLLYPMRTSIKEEVLSLKKKMSKGLSRELNNEKDESQIPAEKQVAELTAPGMKRSLSHPVREEGVGTSSKNSAFPLNPIEEEEAGEIPRLDHEESLRVSFHICVWISENLGLAEVDRINMMSLSLDLVMEIMKLCGMSEVRELLQNQSNNFIQLFLNILRLGSSSLLDKFKVLLQNFANPRNAPRNDETYLANLKAQERQKNLAERTALEEIKQLLIYHLQTILQWLLDYALVPSKDTAYAQLCPKGELPLNNWLEHVKFVLELLLLATDKVTKSSKDLKSKKVHKQPQRKSTLKEEINLESGTSIQNNQQMSQPEVLLPPGIFRSISVGIGTSESREPEQISPQRGVINLEKAGERSTSLSLSTAVNLISLLSPQVKMGCRPNFNFSSSAGIWSSVMSAILKVKVSLLIEAKVFDSLVNAFLSANEEIQHNMFSEILLLTQNMISKGSYQKEFCNAVLSLLFTMLESFTAQMDFQSFVHYDPIIFNLVKGWLDILLTKSTPKPDDFYTKPFQKAFCKLNAQGALNLLVNLSKYLRNHLNIGGNQGAQMSDELTILKLNLADDMLKLLVFSESNTNVLAISELFSNVKHFAGQVGECLRQIIEWYLMNKTTEAGNSPATDAIKSISDQVKTLFEIVTENDEVSKISLKKLVEGCRTIDNQILKQTSTISIVALVHYNRLSCKILEELFDLWVTSDNMASHAAFDVQGFSFLLDRMGLSGEAKPFSERQEERQVQNVSNLLETDLYDFITSSNSEKPAASDQSIIGVKPLPSESNNPAPPLSISEADLKEEEFANKITIINQPGQHWNSIAPDWSVNKKGARARILFFQMNNQFYNEYCLLLQLDKVCEMKQLKIGLNTVWTEYTDKVLGLPSSILIEGGMDQNKLTSLGILEPIHDEGYSNFSVKLYRKNFLRIKSSGSSLDESINSLSSSRIKFIKFRFRRPVVTFCEGISMLSGKIYKNICLSIAFLSITGIEVSKFPANIRPSLFEIQKNSALQVLGNLCKTHYTETLTTLANSHEVISKVKATFNTLSALLINHETWLSPIFLAIASHNPTMGDWIIDNFLNLTNSHQPHAKMILEILLSQPALALPRLKRLYQFILQEIKATHLNKQPSADLVHKYSSLVPFTEAFSTALRLSSQEISNLGNTESLALECSKSEIDALLSAFDHQHNNSNVARGLLKLIVTLLHLPAGYHLSDDKLLEYALDKIWNCSSEKIYYLEILAPLLIGSSEALAWLSQNSFEKLNKLLQNFYQRLSEFDSENEAHKNAVKQTLAVLNAITSYNEKVKKHLIAQDWHVKLYHQIKTTDESSKTILKLFDRDTLNLIVDFIKNVILGFYKAENTFALILKDDLTLLESKRDFGFVTQLLVPLLNAESHVPICLHPYDPLNKRTIADERSRAGLLAKKQSSSLNAVGAFAPKVFTSTMRESFLNTLNTFANKTALGGKLNKSEWQLVLTQTQDSNPGNVDTILTQVLRKGPFALLVEGVNAGKPCVAGVFSSQSVSDFLFENYSYEKIYNIPIAEDCFMFYYEEDFCMHFNIPSYPGQTYFGQFHELEEGAGNGVSFFYNATERIYLSYQPGSSSYFDFNLLEMKPIDENQKNFPTDIPGDLQFKKCEYWILKPQANITTASNLAAGLRANASSLSNAGVSSSNLLYSAWFNSTSPLAYYRSFPVYQVPASISVDKMLEQFFGKKIKVSSRLTREDLKPESIIQDLWEFISKNPQSNNILDIDFDVSDDSGQATSAPKDACAYMPSMNIFESFEKERGVEKILNVIVKSLSLWKNKERSQRWLLWVKELDSFSNLPHFFGLFMKNKACVELLFQILAGAPDEEKPEDKKNPKEAQKRWEEEEAKAVRFSYQILSDVFRVDNDAKIRDFALEKNLIERVLDRISMTSKEEKRKWVDDIVPEKEDLKMDNSNKQPQKEEDLKKKIAKKKGVGYASDNTGQNQKWNVNEYYESKKVKSQQLQSLLSILETFLDFKDWNPPQRLLDILNSSALLPLLESAFRSGSLLDMSKEAELYTTYLNIVRVLSRHKSLIPCLLDLDPHYQPKQTDSIFTLLTNLKELAQIFLNCLNSADAAKDSTQQATQRLAQDILKTFNVVETAINQLEIEEEEDQGAEAQINDILSRPLDFAYRTLLRDLRFDYSSFKDNNNKYKHHYSSNIGTGVYTPPQAKMVRLAQELADLSTALPIEHTNSIFVRCDQSRVDVMKALVMGSAGTPYAHGAFEYDIYFDDMYPNGPPKVNLETTGAGKVRFNPNLYSCGKVCLSLLGTWRGNATENWDPKLSTLLQVLVSLQAIIMSEEIYFNEPGFEGEAGTVEGENKNEAYSNIVRYCNIKYAMTDQLKNPTKGFESVIRRHFYLKKNEILEEVHKWLKYADVRSASYTGLVNDHNSTWCSTFKATKTKYREMLAEAISELEVELNKLPVPSTKDVKKKTGVRKIKLGPKKKVDLNEGVADLEQVDVGYEVGALQQKELDITAEEVKDRWSRYIGAMGIDAVAKQASSSVFLSGAGAVGIEIAKNIVLSGVKRFTLHDSQNTSLRDLSGQFFLSEDDIGKNRASSCLEKIKQLNYYVKVDTYGLNAPLPLEIEKLEEILKDYTIVILTESSYETIIAVNKVCRKLKKLFISCDVYGTFARLFNDFGENFEVLDKNGEEAFEVMIKHISNEEKGKVMLLDGVKHNLEDGDYVQIRAVDGMENSNPAKKEEIIPSKEQSEQTSINGTLHKVTVINSNSFYIGDTRNFSPYVRNGIAKLVKVPVNLKFSSFEESYQLKDVPFDMLLSQHDFLKLSHQTILHIAFETLDAFKKQIGKLPEAWNVEEIKKFNELSKTIIARYYEKPEEEKKLESTLQTFAATISGAFPPLAAFFGGFVSQEIIKGLTQKYTPTKQYFYTDCIEVSPERPADSAITLEEFIEKLDVKPRNNRSDALRVVLGSALLEKIHHAKLFMIGAGAIGCELLKNYAMLGLGIGKEDKAKGLESGNITLTDPDVIETSNLNRQFLFREKHLRKPKSSTAAAAALQMNKELKGNLVARLDKVHEGTVHIFSDKFFEGLTIVTNALDNVQARRYVDMRCVAAKTPLIESGTLGPKGHVQVILPFKTESYGSQQDPQEENEIPHCTLKMFPEETLHCVEWARDKFGKLFTARPKGLAKLIDDQNFQITSSQEVKQVNEASRFLKKVPKSFDDCITYARFKFQKYFVNDIRQLMHTYPLDAKTKNGNPFWTLPKRPPSEIVFDAKNLLHASMVSAFACLRAAVFNIKIPTDSRTEAFKLALADKASHIMVPDFKPSEEKAKAISTQVDKDTSGNTEENKENDQAENLPQSSNEDIMKSFRNLATVAQFTKGSLIAPQEFEKDNDANYHIDFIYSLANCRSSNYKLEPMDWITVKLKAGRIIPALATTTAAIAGLQTIEVCKVLKKETKIEDFKNAFLNLAVPILSLSEPGPAPKIVLHSELTVNLWDRWDVKLGKDITIKELFTYLSNTYKLHPRDVIHGSNAVFFSALYNAPEKEKEKQDILSRKLIDCLSLEADDQYADLTVTFSAAEEGEILKGVPPVRVFF